MCLQQIPTREDGRIGQARGVGFAVSAARCKAVRAHVDAGGGARDADGTETGRSTCSQLNTFAYTLPRAGGGTDVQKPPTCICSQLRVSLRMP